MFFIVNEGSFIAIAVGIEVLALSGSLPIDIVAVVLIAVRVDCVAFSVVVPRGVACFAFAVGELVGRSAFLFSHEVSIIIDSKQERR